MTESLPPNRERVNQVRDLARIICGAGLIIAGLITLDDQVIQNIVERTQDIPLSLGFIVEGARQLGIPDDITAVSLMGLGLFSLTQNRPARRLTRNVFNRPRS